MKKFLLTLLFGFLGMFVFGACSIAGSYFLFSFSLRVYLLFNKANEEFFYYFLFVLLSLSLVMAIYGIIFGVKYARKYNK